MVDQEASVSKKCHVSILYLFATIWHMEGHAHGHAALVWEKDVIIFRKFYRRRCLLDDFETQLKIDIFNVFHHIMPFMRISSMIGG